MTIYGGRNFVKKNNFLKVKSVNDHRIAMAFAVMGTKIGPLKINESDSIKTSFPTFKYEFNKIGGLIS